MTRKHHGQIARTSSGTDTALHGQGWQVGTTWDGRPLTSARTVRIAHPVPVHEAWGSGARGWSQTKRMAFYNGRGPPRTLSARTSKLNSTQQVRGPEEWMPPKHRCAHMGERVVVKIRWGLKADTKEKATLTKIAETCPNTKLTVKKA